MQEKDFINNLWKYFELHANQRMQLMNFYIVIESLFLTGLVTMLNSKEDLLIFELGVCIAMIFFSWIFSQFDLRTRNMIHCCEDAIKHVEEKYVNDKGYDKEIMIFSVEEKIRKDSTYTRLMKLEFMFFKTIGWMCIIWLLYQEGTSEVPVNETIKSACILCRFLSNIK